MFERDKLRISATIPGPAANAQDQMSKIETVVGANCYFTGTIQSDSGICIDGFFKGNLYATGNVVVTESATVIAEIQASNIVVSGSIKGKTTANRIEITETGKFWGDLVIGTIVMYEGAYHEGCTTMANVIAPPSGG